jgi:hypothetical protein
MVLTIIERHSSVRATTNPVVITETVDGSTFTISGTIQSKLTLDAFSSAQNPNNHFYLEAANWGQFQPEVSAGQLISISATT